MPLAMALEPMAIGLAITSWAFDLFYSLVLFSAVFALATGKRYRAFVLALGFLTLIATWLVHLAPKEWSLQTQLTGHGLGFCFMAFAAYATVREVIRAHDVDLDTILGSIAGYLLLGSAWAALYSMLHLVSPDSFEMGALLPQFLNGEKARFPVFIYYSFVTLTTLGYGDMTPVTQAARTLSWLEAVAGQFYIATLVAATISVLTAKAVRRRHAG